MYRTCVAFIVLCTAVFAIGSSVMAKPAKVRATAVEETVDACKPTTWKAVSPDTVMQAMDLIKQFNAANDQLAKLGASGSDTVTVSRRAPASGYKVYEGDWNEVREALQAMLKGRLAKLACTLQSLGVDMRQAQNSQISRR